jgi:hypothetical protein
MRQFIYSISCDCGRCYIGETGRPLGVRMREHLNNLKQVGFEVLTAVSMTIAVFWVVAPCSLVEVYS